MTTPRIGALFAGYGGLDLAVSDVLGGELAWYSEVDRGALKILNHRFPDVPNVGDVTTADWSQVEPVDVLTGGSPCQDLSHAGKRAGMTTGTRSNLWVAMREAIAQLRPALVVWENVRGAYSAPADSSLEHCPGCMGGPRDRGPVLRALGRVLGDLADLGYDARWHGVRAADVGAPHGRFRVFLVAHPADAVRGRRDGWTPDPFRLALRGAAAARGGEGARLLPSPRTSDTNGAGHHGTGGPDLRTAVAMLPTPRAHDRKANGSPSEVARHSPGLGAVGALLPTPVYTDALGARNATAWRDPDAGPHNSGTTLTDVVWQINGHTDARLLPTPRAGDGDKGGPNQAGSSGDLMLPSAVQASRWGAYAEAVAQWEHHTRPAPDPTELGKKGSPRLAPAFSEWMMGLPAGWVTDVPGITRNEALKALGNGVVPQQAAHALRVLL